MSHPIFGLGEEPIRCDLVKGLSSLLFFGSITMEISDNNVGKTKKTQKNSQGSIILVVIDPKSFVVLRAFYCH